MKRNKMIFVISFMLFVGVVIYFTIDMANRTSPPWERKKSNLKKYSKDFKNFKHEDSIWRSRRQGRTQSAP